jgi:anti-sigma regulatory factor (Ser/Thr protein kinase)
MALDTGFTDLRHSAFVHDSEEDFLARSVPFVREGLEAGEGAIVARTRPGLAVMREALGDDADRVRLIDVSSAYTRPARMLTAYHHVFAEQLWLAPALRVVADVQYGPDPAEWDLWTGYEAVANRAFGHLPVWVLCSYDAKATPGPILEGVWQTHREVLSGETWTTSERFEDPDDVLRRLTPAPEPLPELRSLPVGGDLEQLRERLAGELAAERVGGAKALELLVAATELAKNAVEHGGGIVDVRVGRARGRFVCEIVDGGPGFDDPAAGYVAPREGGGTGLWVARQLAWQLELFRSPAGFTARIWL